MKVFQNIKLSIKALLLNKSRTYFSVAGMGVGIVAVVTTVSIGNAAKDKALEVIEAMGTNVIVVNAGKFTEVFGRKREVTNITTLTLQDANEISTFKKIDRISPLAEKILPVKHKNILKNTLVQGVSPDYRVIKNYSMAKGQFFTELNNEHSDKIAVLGSEAAHGLFKDSDPIDQIIFINKSPYRVVGVLNTIGSGADVGNIDNVVMVPINTALRRVFNIDYINKMFLQINALENMDAVENQIVHELRINHKLDLYDKKDDFTIINQLNAIRTSKETSRTFNLLILGVAAISLIIGGAGILAVMILSVKERIKEIGLRLSVGAKKRNIITQFLSESLIISGFGGVVGTLVGCATSLLVDRFTEWPTLISAQSVLVSLSFSLIIGLLFGVIPAIRASNLDPIIALKTE